MPPTNTTTPRRWFDGAIVLTLATATLYALGWVYWNAYFHYFGFSVSVVGLSFDQVVATTWWFAPLFVLIAAHRVVGFENLDDQTKVGDVKIPVVRVVAFVLLYGALPFTALADRGLWLTVVVLAVSVVLLVALARLLRGRAIPLTPRSPLDWGMGVLIGGALLFGLYAGGGLARARAEARGESATCITIQTSTDPQPAPNLVLLARSSGMLFLARPDTSHRQRGALVIAESAIRSATLSNCSP